MTVRAVATDIDGTLTRDRGSTVFPEETIRALRMLEENGVMVILVSSNALPIIVGLTKYLGLTGPAIGETGALIYYGGRVVSTTRFSAREAAMLVEKELGDLVEPSWQNMFRLHDYAFRVRRGVDAGEAYGRVKSLVESRFGHVKVGFSGYAIHLTPRDTGKGKALLEAYRLAGLSPGEVVGVGDSAMDLEIFEAVGIRAAVSNADEELRRSADIVLSRPSGYGFAELAEMIISGRIRL